MRKIAIVGVGNLLQTDDGVGIWVVEELKKQKLPDNIEVIDAGTDPMTVLEAIEDKDKAIIVDAFVGGHPPGTIYRSRIDDFNFDDEESIDISLHGVSFLDVLKTSKHAFNLPKEIIIIGIEPAVIDIGMELSEELNRMMPNLIDVIMEEAK
jgi:hydrogenase maturation protease